MSYQMKRTDLTRLHELDGVSVCGLTGDDPVLLGRAIARKLATVGSLYDGGRAQVNLDLDAIDAVEQRLIYNKRVICSTAQYASSSEEPTLTGEELTTLTAAEGMSENHMSTELLSLFLRAQRAGLAWRMNGPENIEGTMTINTKGLMSYIKKNEIKL